VRVNRIRNNQRYDDRGDVFDQTANLSAEIEYYRARYYFGKMWQELLTKYLTEYAEQSAVDTPQCSHDERLVESGNEICVECGVIVDRKFCTTQYVATCTARRKIGTCPIYAEMPSYFATDVKNLTIEIYKYVTDEKIYRSTLRRAIIAACLHRSSIILGKPVFFDDLLILFNLKTSDANKGISYVASNIYAKSQYVIPFFSEDVGIDSLLSDLKLINDKRAILNVFEYARSWHIVSQAHIKTAICGCVWFYLKHVNGVKKISLKKFSIACGLSTITVHKKYLELKKSVIRTIMKRVFSACMVARIGIVKGVDITAQDGSVTVHEYANPDTISVVGSDAFVYPIEDVDDVLEWNALLSLAYVDPDKNSFVLGAKLYATKRDVVVQFYECAEPLRSMGEGIVRFETEKLFKWD
jgi:hypothetical protein